ncbi:MAG TPA: SEC-C metal-binding domain-containing protein, partial [Polyangiaceae bacterium]
MTTQKIGRNDPCPCGSGAKYKRCCQAKDEAARRQQATRPAVPARPVPPVVERRAPPPRSSPSPPEPTATERWWLAWDEKVAGAESAEARLALARQALADAPEPDGDFLRESFDPVMVDLEGARRHTESIALVEQIEARFPNAYRREEAYFALTRFESALELGGPGLVDEA